MMRFITTTILMVGLLNVAPAQSTSPTFEQLIVRKAQQKLQTSNIERHVNDALLEKAIPLSEYEQKTGVVLSDAHRVLEDFVADGSTDYDMSGYSLKYTKCQPVQFFSENAVKAGEHSPMITQDIVLLRLCPKKSCSASGNKLGCTYNYAEYALALGDYVSIMLKYKRQLRANMCAWCEDCANGGNRKRTRKLADEDAAADAAGDDANAAQSVENQQAASDEAASAVSSTVSSACTGYNTYCADYSTLCSDANDNTYLDYAGYQNYIECTQVKYNNYAYYVRPSCDGSDGAIKMAVYYDSYCIQYAGNDVPIKNLGLGFKDGFFSDFNSDTCINCAESVSPEVCVYEYLEHLSC
jgi:hypothetical protein